MRDVSLNSNVRRRGKKYLGKRGAPGYVIPSIDRTVDGLTEHRQQGGRHSVIGNKLRDVCMGDLFVRPVPGLEGRVFVAGGLELSHRNIVPEPNLDVGGSVTKPTSHQRDGASCRRPVRVLVRPWSGLRWPIAHVGNGGAGLESGADRRLDPCTNSQPDLRRQERRRFRRWPLGLRARGASEVAWLVIIESLRSTVLWSGHFLREIVPNSG